MSGMQTLRLLRSEDGAATVEFMIMFPLVLFVFFTSFEAGYAMVRAAFLTRALDQGLHEVQLGNITSTDALRLALCQKLAVAACDSDVTVELTVLSADRSNPPVLGSACQTQDVTIRTGTRATWIADGGPNELVIVRVCQRAKALFPKAVAGLTPAIADAQGYYRLVVSGAFLNAAE